MNEKTLGKFITREESERNSFHKLILLEIHIPSAVPR